MSPHAVEALEAARQQLPAWLPWAGVAVVPIAFLAGVLFESFAALVGWLSLRKLAADAHWTERARSTYPVVEALGGVLWLTVVVTAIWAWHAAGPLSLFPPKALSLLAAAAAYFGGACVVIPAARSISRRRVSFSRWWRCVAATWLLAGGASLVIVIVFLLISDRFDLRTVAVLCLGGGAIVWLWYGGGLQIGRAFGLVTPPSPRLVCAVESLARPTGTRPILVYEVDTGQANGWAVPLAGALLVSKDALDVLGDSELAALCAHEMGHLSESRRMLFMRMLPGMALLSLPALRPLGNTWGWPQVLLAPLAAMLSMSLLSRLWMRLEQRSDRIAVQHEAEPGAFARALEKLHELNLAPAVMRQKKGAHPHLYDRLVAAGVTPAYPRPAPPSSVVAYLAMLPIFIVGLTAALGLFVFSVPAWHSESESAIEWRLALLPRPAWDLDELARLHDGRGDTAAAIALGQAATVLDQKDARYPAHWAGYLARAGRCDEAARAFENAARRPRCGCQDGDSPLDRALDVMKATCWRGLEQSAEEEEPAD